MNIKDCINIIKNCTTLACEYHIKNKCDYSYEVRENRFECAKEIAIHALEKHIPKRPIKYDDCENFNVVCVCGMCTDTRFFHGYCTWCGQKLDI